MRKVMVYTSVTMDGVMQSPGHPEEDTRGGIPLRGLGNPVCRCDNHGAGKRGARRPAAGPAHL